MTLLDELKQIMMSNQKPLLVMLLFICLDVITGVIKACIEGKLNSTKLKEGIFHKVLELILVVIGVAFDFLLEVQYIANGTLIALVAMESISVLENIGTYIPLPDILKKIIESLNADNPVTLPQTTSDESKEEEAAKAKKGEI